MARKKAPETTPLFDVKTTTAPCVPAIRERVNQWRAANYPDVTDTTRRLLNWWFHTDHRLGNGQKFKYHHFQQQAIETLVYLYEVAKVRRQKPLIETFAHRQDLKLLQYDDFARYCVKMATGSGKTKVMALAIAWQYFNAVAEALDDFAKTFLIIAPNVIVFERLRTDFGGGRVFTLDPVIPDVLRIYWDFSCYVRGEAERASSLGALYLTNIQQVYDRSTPADDESDFVAVTLDGAHFLIETKGLEDVNVVHKDRAARLWCENATHLTGTSWSYLKVRQTDYVSLQPTRFADLSVLAVS